MSFELRIIRDRWDEVGTEGVLFIGTKPFCETVERPWLNNRAYVSCIPDGRYPVIISNGAAEGKKRFRHLHLSIDDVAGRSAILIHQANEPDDLHGCIGPGRRIENRRNWVSHSFATLNRLILELVPMGLDGSLVIERSASDSEEP